MIAKILTRAPYPRPSELCGDVSPELDLAVMNALAHERDQRTPSARAFAEALNSALSPPPREPSADAEPPSSELAVERATPLLATPRRVRPLRLAAALSAISIALLVGSTIVRSRTSVVRATVSGASIPPHPDAGAGVTEPSLDPQDAAAPRVDAPPPEGEATDAAVIDASPGGTVAPPPRPQTRGARSRPRLPAWAR